MEQHKYTTGGGLSRKDTPKHVKRGKKRLAIVAALVTAAAAVGVVFGANSLVTARAAGNTVVDPDTTNVWNQIAASSTSTQNIGRIWTDKSVFDNDYKFDSDSPLAEQDVKIGDSDFLVSLSALSSTSNLKTTTKTSQPLDIVLVLDDSGSMAYSIDSDMPYQTVYTAVSADQVVESHGHTESGWFGGTNYIQDTLGGEYYVKNDRGGYDRVVEDTETHSGGWYQSYEEHIRWTVNGQTVDPETTQFYTRAEYDLSERRGALQYAVNNFIDQTAAMNAQIADENDKIRISIVVFESNSSIENHLTVCEGANVSTLKNTVNSLEANGATNAGAGMTNANNELRTNSNRDNTKQIVIFFTDGVPTTSSSFNTTVANNAVSQAAHIKGRGGSVYSIGIFDGADPSQTEVGRNPNDTDRANVFMNAVSSNYPNATTWNNLGRRATGDPDFYKSADNAGSLNEVFQDIFDESTENAGSGSPIEEVTQEGALNPGTLTFTDTLGSYMTVSGDTMTVVYGDKKFTSTNKTTLDNVETYHFEGKVAGNDVYKESDLADLTVTVTHGSNLATGDVVTAKIPASLIPMRNYNVDTNEKTMTVTAAYPIRLFFGVSLKDNAKKAIEQGSGDVYDAIVESNKTDDGNATFYSNLFTNGSGDTTASFTPSDGNKFYYYTSDTALYLDEQCSQRATRDNINGHNTLYYSEPYWEITSGTSAQEVTQGIAINNTGQDWERIRYDRQGNAYIPAGTQRLDRPATLNKNKTENKTGTALTVLTPEWDGTAVSQHLGNNGKIAFPLPGELEIKKTVDWGNASDETKQNQNSFTFTVNFNGDETLSGSFAYDIYATGEEPVDNGTVADGGTITLKDGRRAVIKGLPTGTTFTVTEEGANKNGFTTTDTVTADPENDTTDGVASGTIVGGSQQSVSFQNNYKADEPVKLSTKTDLKAKKTLTGRDWRESDEFSFQITQIDNGAPTVQMDDPTKIDITQQTDQQTASFGDITFSESGQYRFRVEELSDTDQGITPIAGIDYSGAIYRVTVDVADAGQGALEVTSVLIEQMTNDDGGQGSGEVQGDTMTFTNKYVVGQASETLQGKKIYTDTTAGNKIDAGKFSFQLEALGGYVTGTVEGDAQLEDYTIAAASDAMPKPAGMTGTTLETGNVGDTFQFPTIYFDGNDVGKTFEYRITELPHKYQGDAELGMTYDTNTSYVVKIVVTEEQDPDSENQKAVIKAEPSLQPSEITFTNTYEPTPAKLEGNTAIHGTKTLDGRKMKEGESFYFQLSASNDNANTVLASPKTVTVSSQDEMGFSFGKMTFTKVGEYVFTVNEVADTNGAETADGSGMTFDKSIYTVTVNVTDEKDGSLKADVTYKKDDGTSADEAAFTNVYYDEKDAKDVFDAEDPTTEVDGKLVGVGDTLRYTIDWAATEAGTVTVTDVVPAGTTVVDDSVSQGGTLSEDGRTITWTFENQAFGACGTVSFDVTVDESAATVGEVQNSATITVGDNTYTTNTTKNPVPEKTETSNPDKIGAGTTLSYQISFTNTDGEGATATVVDSLTKGQNYVAGTAKVNGEAMEPAAEGDATTGQTLTWNLSNLAADAEVTITFDVTVTRDAGAEVNNTATVNDHSTNTTTTPYPSDDKKDVFEAEDPTTSVNGKLVGVGDELTYTIDWAADVDGTVTITDTIPAGTELVNNTISDNGSYDEETNTITWSLGEKSMGDKGTVSFNVVVTDDAAENDPVTNTANITVGENDPKVVTATTDIPVKDYEDTTPETGVQVGDVLTYTIEWANDSGQASDVVITDTLPLGLTYVGVVEGATEPEVSEVEGQQVLTWTLEDQADGAEGTVTFNAMVNEDAITAEDSLHNQATIIVGENDYKTNTTGDEPDDQPKTGSLTVTKTVVAEAGTTIDTNKSFSFTLGLKAANGTTVLTNEYTAQAYNAEGTPVGPEFTVSDGGTFTLKHGESMVISGLPEGATYSVTEAATDGYTADAATMNGTIPTGEDNASASFTNTYALTPTTLSGAVNLNVVKNLEGRSWLDTDEFSFVLAADEANPAGATLPEQTELTIAGNTEGHTASFGDITFTQPGTFTFTVTEQPSTVAGVTNDANATRTIVVSVVDNHDGTMTATVDAENSDDLVFTNTFETTPVTLSGASAIKVQKTLAGRDWADGETFEFTLAAASEGAPMPESAKLTIDEPTTGSVNTSAFGDMTFTQPGTYVYTISETAGEDATISYDGHTAEVTVAVFQGGNGHAANELWAQVSYNNGTATNEADQAVTGAAAFTNTQGLESKVELTGTKEITGRDFIEGDAFTFTVTGEDDAPMPDGVDENGSVTINPTEGSKATIDFGAITFTEAGEYVYHVAEAEGTIDGMTYDTARRDVIITVTDDGLGNLSAQITSGADQLAWTNAWAFQGATFAELNGTKTMSGKELKNGQFTFLVQPQDNAPMGDTLPANFNGDATQNEDGTWTAPVSLLSNIAFDEAGDYVYVISEVNDGQPGVTYDGTQYRVTLSVANDGTVSQKIEQSENGTDWTDATAVAFANSYATDDEATLEGAVNLTGTKTLQGRDWLDDDSFTFLLAQTEGNKDAVRMPAETAVVVQGNYSDGAAVPFAFGDIVFTEAGDYAFTISEQQPGFRRVCRQHRRHDLRRPRCHHQRERCGQRRGQA